MLIKNGYAYLPAVKLKEEENDMFAPWHNGPQADMLVGRAYELFDEGDYTAALDYLERALSVTPNHFGALCLKSISLARQGRAEEALVAAYAAIKANGVCGTGYTARAAALIQLGKNAEAAADLEYAAPLMPECPRAHYYTMVCWANLGKVKRVKEGLQKIRHLGGGYIERLLSEESLQKYRQEPWYQELLDRR